MIFAHVSMCAAVMIITGLHVKPKAVLTGDVL